VEGAIEVERLSKAFSIRYNKLNSLKSQFVGIFNKRYREEIEIFWALRDIDFVIEPGEAFGIIGRNGSGKSTLLRLIAGIYPPTSGAVRLPKGTRIGAMIELGVGFHPELTGRENIFLGASIHGLKRKEIESLYPAIVEFSELGHFMDTPIKNYSSGMHGRLGFALAINLKPTLFIIDEVLAVGDEGFQKKCLDAMKKFKTEGKTIILVSHDPGMIASVCVLEHGVQKFVGKSDAAIEAYHKLLG